LMRKLQWPNLNNRSIFARMDWGKIRNKSTLQVYVQRFEPVVSRILIRSANPYAKSLDVHTGAE
jgi:hypothetical protein